MTLLTMGNMIGITHLIYMHLNGVKVVEKEH